MRHSVKCITDFPPVTDYKYDEALWQHQHGDALVLINCHASDIYYPEHWTPLSIKCAFNGKEYYKLKNTTYAVSERNFLVLNEGTRYASYILSDSVTESFTLNFTQYNLQLLSTIENNTAQLLLDDPFILKAGTTTFIEKLYSYSPGIDTLIQRLKSRVHQAQPDELAIHESLYCILEEIFNLNKLSIKEAGNLPAKKRSTREELYKRLNIAKDFLTSCYAEEITLDILAQTCYLNPCYLLREFKNLYHVTPHQYLTHIRMQEAERMISTSGKPVFQIMHEIGFEDAASFTKLFKKRFGLPPAAYRSKLGQS